MDTCQANSVRIVDLLREWDTDGDGQVSKKEFRKAVTSLGLEATREDMDAVFVAIDTDGSGSIDYTELKKALHRKIDLDPSLAAGAAAARKGMSVSEGAVGSAGLGGGTSGGTSAAAGICGAVGAATGSPRAANGTRPGGASTEGSSAMPAGGCASPPSLSVAKAASTP